MFKLLFEFRIVVSNTIIIFKMKIRTCLICALRNKTPIFDLKFQSLIEPGVDFNFADQSSVRRVRNEI